jgi:hypothetical protein
VSSSKGGRYAADRAALRCFVCLGHIERIVYENQFLFIVRPAAILTLPAVSAETQRIPLKLQLPREHQNYLLCLIQMD